MAPPNPNRNKNCEWCVLFASFEDVKDLEKAGTELAPTVLKVKVTFVSWKTGHWMIYPGGMADVLA